MSGKGSRNRSIGKKFWDGHDAINWGRIYEMNGPFSRFKESVKKMEDAIKSRNIAEDFCDESKRTGSQAL